MLPETLFCLAVGIIDGSSIVARCENAGSYQEINVHLGGIQSPQEGEALHDESKNSLSKICYMQHAVLKNIEERQGQVFADVQCHSQNAAALQLKKGMARLSNDWKDRHYYLERHQDEAATSKLGIWR